MLFIDVFSKSRFLRSSSRMDFPVDDLCGVLKVQDSKLLGVRLPHLLLGVHKATVIVTGF